MCRDRARVSVSKRPSAAARVRGGEEIETMNDALGDAAFVAETLRRKGDKLQAKFETVTSKLEYTISPFNNSKFQLSLRFLGV